MQKRKTVSAVVAVAVLAAVGVYAAYAAEAPADATFVGSKKCRLCHLKEFKTWQATKHATNFETLIGDERKDPACVTCHTTGFGQPGGFTSEEETPDMASVGCESCHGAGSAHMAASKDAPDTGEWDTKIDKKPRLACTVCHNPHISQKAIVEALRAGG